MLPMCGGTMTELKIRSSFSQLFCVEETIRYSSTRPLVVLTFISIELHHISVGVMLDLQ